MSLFGILATGNLSASLKDSSDKLWPVLLTNWKVWPVA